MHHESETEHTINEHGFLLCDAIGTNVIIDLGHSEAILSRETFRSAVANSP